MADSTDQAARLSISPPFLIALVWGFAVACATFFLSLIAVSSQVSPSIFPVLARGLGLKPYSTAFTLVSSPVDGLLLLVSASLILVVLETTGDFSFLMRILIMLPAVLIVFFFLMPSVFLTLGALGTIIAIIYIVYESDALLGVSPGKVLSSVLVIMTGAMAVVSAVSAARWAFNAVDGAVPLSDWTWGPSVFVLRLLNQSYWLLPRMFLLLFLAWVVRLVLALYWGDVRGFFSGISAHFGLTDTPSEEPLISDGMAFYLILASVVGAVFVGLYPYLPKINPSSTLVGYDVRILYYPSVQAMLGMGQSQALWYAVKNLRTLTLVLEYAIAEPTGSADFAVRVVPALLALLLTASTYYFVKAGFGDRVLAATASLFAVFSFTVVAGINAGLDANWLADSEALVLFSVLLLGLNRSDRRYVIISIVPSVLLLLTHPWTWLIIMGVLATYAVFTGVRALFTSEQDGLRFELTSIGFVLIVNMVAYGIDNLAGVTGGIQYVLVPSGAATMSLSNLPTVVGSLQSTVVLFLGGALDNPLIVFLAIIGVLAISDTYSRMNRLLLSWVAVVSVAILFATYSLGFPHARLIFVVPVQVLAAMGLLSTLRYATNLMTEGGYENRGLAKAFVIMTYVSVFAVLMSFTLQNVGFIYTGA